MSKFIKPKNYKSQLDIRQTERAIKLVKDFFQQQLATELNLYRVTAPLFVFKGTGINDDLNGIEKPVSFKAADISNSADLEIVQSLAKWKRLTLAEHKIPEGYGIYTDMNAIRPDEELSNLHSLYVDQWDWERVISAKDRNLEFLKAIVTKIYEALKRLDFFVHESFPCFSPMLPQNITFIHAEDAQAKYPKLSPKQREYQLTKEYGAVFLIGIGGKIVGGDPHDLRAPDYDDWSTKTSPKHQGLNGDILLWNSILDCSFELSSMGIRVDKKALLKQLKLIHQEQRQKLYFHQALLNDQLPLTIGGGIGQSRLCMYFLRKAHIGEVQASVWSHAILQECKKNKIELLSTQINL